MHCTSSTGAVFDDLAEIVRIELDIQLEVQRDDPAFRARLPTYGGKA